MIQTFEQFINESSLINEEVDQVNKLLSDLKSGIKNDYSIQRYSLGWSDVTTAIDKYFKKIKYKDTLDKTIDFQDSLIKNVIRSKDIINDKNLVDTISSFGRELEINIDTLNNKQNPKNR